MANCDFEKSIEDIACCDAPAIKVVGAGGTGKTMCIAKRVARLLSEGVPAREIIVFAATVSAVDRLRALIRQQADTCEDVVEVLTPREYWVHMLDSPEARLATGRVPRLLADFEEGILIEDMKTTGVKVKRLREMLKFFYREWTELGDLREGFLVEDEEFAVHDAIKRHLRLRGGMLRYELSNTAYRYLHDNPEQGACWHRSHVLADDWQNYNRASQLALSLIADRSLFVCGNEDEQVITAEPFPYRSGFRDFESEHEGAAVFQLSSPARSTAAIAAIGNALSKGDRMEGGWQTRVDPGDVRDSSSDSVYAVRWPVPNEEFLGIARHVKRRVKGDDGYTAPARVFIAVPNALWGRSISTVLNRNGVRTVEAISDRVLGGDPRKPEKCASLRAYTALNLVARPDDMVAWRTWCGLGNYLCHSNHWCRLEEYACEHGSSLFEALQTIAETENAEPFLGADELAARYREGRKLIESCSGKRGYSLVNALDCTLDEPPADFAALIEPVLGTEDAGELLVRAQDRFEIRFDDDAAVRIGLPHASCGLEFDMVIATGMVDGFWPSADAFGIEHDDDFQADVRARYRRELYALVSKAKREVVFSCFQKDESNTASALGMWVRRVRRENGQSMALLSSSCLLDDVQDSLPGFESSLD